MTAMNIDFPYHIGANGRTADTTYPDHVRDMIEQLLFTRPGERVNRPDFGCGLLDLVFEPNSPELAAALQVSAEGALNRWLGDLIEVNSLTITAEDSTMRIDLKYTLSATGEQIQTSVEGSPA
jgi:phage baseplate assembly protein W